MMNDDFVLLSAYLDNELSAAERTAIEARLRDDPDLRAELAELEQVIGMVKAMPVIKAPRNYTLDPAVYGKKATPKVIRYPWRQLVAAAAVVVIVAAGVFLALRQNESAIQTNDSAPPQDVAVQSEVTGQEVAVAPTATLALTLSAVTDEPEFAAPATAGETDEQLVAPLPAGTEVAANSSATGFATTGTTASDLALRENGLPPAPAFAMPEAMLYDVTPEEEASAQTASVAPPMPGGGGAGGTGEQQAFDPGIDAAAPQAPQGGAADPFLPPSGAGAGGGGGAGGAGGPGGGVTTLNQAPPSMAPADGSRAKSVFTDLTATLEQFVTQIYALWR